MAERCFRATSKYKMLKFLRVVKTLLVKEGTKHECGPVLTELACGFRPLQDQDSMVS